MLLEFGQLCPTAVGFDPAMHAWSGHNDEDLSTYWKIWVGITLMLILISFTPYSNLQRVAMFFWI
jgi:hypothetical protein